MFNKKINDFFAIENKFFKKEQKRMIRDQIQRDEYRNEMM